MANPAVLRATRDWAGKHLQLVYVDYRDHLTPHQVQWYLRQDWEPLEESIKEWLFDAETWTRDLAVNEIAKKLGVEDLGTEDREAVENLLGELDTSDPLADLLRNTPTTFFFYDLGLVIAGDSLDENVRLILKAMQVKERSADYALCRERAEELAANAYYGGSLVVLFSTRPREFGPARRYLKFREPYLCIMDRVNGSGMHEAWPEDVAVVFDKDNLHVDDVAPGYSYSRQVCGLVSDPFNNGAMDDRLSGWKLIRSPKSAELRAEMQREALLEEHWRRTRACTPGDMRFTRHPSSLMKYQNGYPAGTTCKACGTFWID